MPQYTCTLCGLPTPDPPITTEEVDGVFCCSGCLQVHQLLEDMDAERADQIRKETIEQRHREQRSEELPESCEEAFLKVDGMHCSTCENFIESISRYKDGIYKSEASYATELVKVYYNPERLSREDLPGLFTGMGYTAYPTEHDRTEEAEQNTIARLVIGGFFSIIGLLLYALFLYPSYVSGEGFIPLTTQEQLFFVSNIFVMTTFVLAYTGFPILRSAWVSVSVMTPNMDLLIAIAAVSAYLFSTGALLTGSHEVYFDVTMAIVMVVSIGNYYERRMKKSKNSLLAELMDKRIKHARVRRNGHLGTVELEELSAGDQVIVRAGERIPVDGTVVEGHGVVNEALITGESLPVSKQEGDRVVSGTILTQHALTIKTGPQVESTMEKMIRLMWDIQATRSGRQRIADRIAAWFVPGVLVLGVVTFFYYLISGATPTSSLLSALSVLIVSCPCALGLATPLAVASGIREALNNQIIFKTGALFEEQPDPDILAFDKTGTLTTGRMHLLDEGSNPRALRYAQAIEQYSSHPIAKAISNTPSHTSFNVHDIESYSTGICGVIDGVHIFVGQPEWLAESGFEISRNKNEQVENARQHGQVPVGVAWDGSVHSVLVVGDQIREETESFVSQLRDDGKKIAIITGDSETASEPLRKRLKPDFLFPIAQPESKTNIIRKLKETGTVAMVGDGSNDALALAEADMGIAFGDLTAIAAESAQIVIPGERLLSISDAFSAVKQTKLRIRQNLGWAFLYNATTIPLAVGGMINPLFAALAMAASSLLVVGNSSRKMKFGN